SIRRGCRRSKGVTSVARRRESTRLGGSRCRGRASLPRHLAAARVWRDAPARSARRNRLAWATFARFDGRDPGTRRRRQNDARAEPDGDGQAAVADDLYGPYGRGAAPRTAPAHAAVDVRRERRG